MCKYKNTENSNEEGDTTFCKINIVFNTFAASYLNTQGLNNSCLKSRQLRPYSI